MKRHIEYFTQNIIGNSEKLVVLHNVDEWLRTSFKNIALRKRFWTFNISFKYGLYVLSYNKFQLFNFYLQNAL